ncbi:unnamed protein product [Lathyrus sativus]|nr:unnamed protein product [Lathyrus sativus]
MGWRLNVGSKFGINGDLFWSSAAAMFALDYNIPKLIEHTIIDSNGLSATGKTFHPSPNMPMMDTEALVWSNVGADSISLKKVFNHIKHCSQTTSLSNWWLCNTAYELEPRPLSFLPKFLPIGPLLNNYENKSGKSQLVNFGKKIYLA